MTGAGAAQRAIGEITGREPEQVRPISGGDTAAAFAVRFTDGSAAFAKRAPERMPGAIEAEAASLEWLAEPGVAAVPAVLGHDSSWLVTEFVESSRPAPSAAAELGGALARLHDSGADAFGAAPPGGPADAWIGLAPMRNEPAVDWPTFYARHRIEPYLRSAVDSGAIDRDGAAVISRVCDELDDLAGPAEPPARLHGDLWSGNVHWAERAWLIDPAAHGGHRETDLAMLQLFGCPQLEQILEAYQQVSPLADGWRERVGLHQLFPLLVHAVLFGGGFGSQAVAAARGAFAAR